MSATLTITLKTVHTAQLQADMAELLYACAAVAQINPWVARAAEVVYSLTLRNGRGMAAVQELACDIRRATAAPFFITWRDLGDATADGTRMYTERQPFRHSPTRRPR